MKVRVDDPAGSGAELEVAPEITLAALTVRAAEATGVTLAHDSHLLFFDADRFYELPQEKSAIALSAVIGPDARGPIAIRLIPVERCMHGSPGVPGHGFLCGWC